MLIEQKEEEAYNARMKALDDKIKALEEEAEKYGKRHEEKIKAIQEENAIREAEEKMIKE